MNKSKFVALFVAIAGVAATAPAAAQSFYFGGSIGNSEAHQDACQNAQAICDRSDTTWSGNAGFMFTPNWGVELGYRDMGKVMEWENPDRTSARWKTKSGEAVIVGALPIHKVSLYGKVGGYYAKTKVQSDYLTESESKSKQWTYGVGIRYDLLKHLAVRAEWQRYNNVGGKDVGFRADVNVISGGLLIFF